MLDISKDIHSLSDFKRNTTDFLEQMRGTGHPVVLTINGKAELVVQDAASYQKLLDRMDQLEALEGIQTRPRRCRSRPSDAVEENLSGSSGQSVAYQVVLADSAKADANRIYDWVVEQAPVRGPEWFEELIDSSVFPGTASKSLPDGS